MQWGYAAFSIEQALPSLLVLAAPMPLLAPFAQPRRRLLACSPNIAALIGFAISCLAAAAPAKDLGPLELLPLVTLALTTILLVPSVLALKRKWWGVLHLATMAGAVFSLFVAGMSLARDWL